ncbi:hypothetical protein B0I29_120117 [Actinoplanes lutulentus]|uniref:Uncharacterized protein n=2 Tax=Actinoplanes lutulentus TaxID=1287878 RepID=A0A327Z4L2_9ACTN|nr:hypothetical protein B0I29_120117 [Actinoplanes lutulentus]
MSDPVRTVRRMASEILEHLTGAADAAGEKLTEAEVSQVNVDRLLADLATARTSTVRTLPPDPFAPVPRRWVDANGRTMVDIEIEVDDAFGAHLDSLPDANAFILDAALREVNRSTLGRHAYYRRLTAAAQELGLRVGWGADLDQWMDHYPEPPAHLTADVLAAHAEWLKQRTTRR